MKKHILLITLLFLAFAVNAQEQKQKSRKEIKAEREAKLIEQTKQLIESKTFRFTPDRAYPTKGRSISITNFDVLLKSDTIVSYLPYYGRAYVAEYGSTSSPFDFTAPVKDLEETTTKQGAQVIKLKVENGNDQITYRFEIFKTGSTSLDVISTNRQSISFSGYIEKPEDK